MRSPRTRLSQLALATVACTALSTVHIPSSYAAVDGSQAVISEVHGGGGNSGATYTHDFVELYNPTDEPISLDGYAVEYFSAGGNSGGKVTLKGTIAPGGYYLVQGSAGDGGTKALPSPDAEGGLNMSGSKGSVKLFDASGADIDTVGYGTASIFEGSPVSGHNASNSVQRDASGTDTDNNSADFTADAPTPQNSGETGTPTDPTEPDPTDPEAITPIADIQGTGAASPLDGKNVTTIGEVTAVFDEGGMKGFMMQTPGTGGTAPAEGDASHGIFVYMGNNTDYPALGEVIEVSGSVSEFYSMTQLSASTIKKAEGTFEPVKAVAIDTLPAGDAAREPFEGMLVLPGTHTVTNNYQLNTYGELGLAPGTEAFRQPSDIHEPSTDPNSPLQQLDAEQKSKLVVLDDGRTKDYMKSDKSTPLPYIAQDGGSTIKPIRTSDQVEFQHPVVVNYSHKFWRFQPTSPVTGNTAGSDLPITWENSRAAEEGKMASVAGDYTVSAFNVLNYFTSLGQDEAGCNGYKDMNGVPVATNRCNVRGAYTPEAFSDQQEKIVAAINELDSDVVALSEIENGHATTGDVAKRDNALNQLVSELNKAGGNWAAVESPSDIPVKGDVIRVAFIYNKDRVEPVGESKIFTDARFTGTAREPLAQEFKSTDPAVTETFVAVANHFKSKGSVANGDADQGDGQGNNPNVRNAQAQAVLDKLAEIPEWADKPTFVMGDLNSYTMEDAINIFRNAGYSVPAEDFKADPSYQFDGYLGSLDHVLAKNVDVADAKVWNINSDESVAFEYSRRKYNTVDFHDATPFRSSDHDPVKVGFSLDNTPNTEAPITPIDADAEVLPEGEAPIALPKELTDKMVDENDAPLAMGPDATPVALDQLPVPLAVKDLPAGWEVLGYKNGAVVVKAPADAAPETEVPFTIVRASDGAVATNATVNVLKQETLRSIEKTEINEAGELIITYTDGTSVNLGKVTGPGEKGNKGEKGEKGEPGDKGEDGRGIQAVEILDNGDVRVTYTDGTSEIAGNAKGPKGEPGDKGPKGEPGDKGEKGEPGDKGEKGSKGDKGDKGQPGIVGAPGKDGVDGKDGRSVTAVEVLGNGDIKVTFSDGTTELVKKTSDFDGTDEKPEPAPSKKDDSNGSSTGISAAALALPLLLLIPAAIWAYDQNGSKNRAIGGLKIPGLKNIGGRANPSNWLKMIGLPIFNLQKILNKHFR